METNFQFTTKQIIK